MIGLNILEKVKTELHLSDEQYERYLIDLKRVDEYLEDHRVFFAEDNCLAFTAHVVTLFMRLENGEKVDGMGDDVLSQLDDQAVAITRGLMELLESVYGQADMAETALVAIHIQTALEMMQEGGDL